MKMPVESGTDEREPMFYAMPQPASPPKNYGGVGAMIYQQPGSSS
jgi:hypothetical protein